MASTSADIALPLPLDAADESAVEADVLALFDAHEPALLRYVLSFGLSAEDSEEVVQDVFVALFRHLRLGRSRSHLRGWLFRVAHNLALKRRRSRAWRALWQPWDVDAAARLADPDRNPEERLIAAARASEWRHTIRSLPDRDRQCLALRAEGLRYRDIARVLGLSLGAVAKSMARTASRLLAHDGERR